MSHNVASAGRRFFSRENSQAINVTIATTMAKGISEVAPKVTRWGLMNDSQDHRMTPQNGLNAIVGRTPTKNTRNTIDRTANPNRHESGAGAISSQLASSVDFLPCRSAYSRAQPCLAASAAFV